jgi:glycine cleavage system aminomethyltransferase T
MVTSRGVRRSPIHDHLKARGAVFGEVAGWERANWFANPGQEREYRYSWKRQNWFDNQRAEHLAVRQAAGLFDMTSFGKIRVEGRDALRLPEPDLFGADGCRAGAHRLYDVPQ